jgi:hypothetical protein
MMVGRISDMPGMGAPDNCLTVRFLFIVSRTHPWLYRHLVERFHEDPDVSVILDRRIGERRSASSTVPGSGERRRAERRRPVSPEDDLKTRSHYIIEV